MNWQCNRNESAHEKVVVFRSLVATLTLNPAVDGSLKTKVVKFLKSMNPKNRKAADALICSFASFSDQSLTNFVQSIVVLISSPSRAIIKSAMQMLTSLVFRCSSAFHLLIVITALIPQLIITLNPQSLSFAKAEDIHRNLMKTITDSLWLISADGEAKLKIKTDSERQAVHETVLQKVVAPSTQYICHLCVNRYSIIDRVLSAYFLVLLVQFTQISPYYRPAMDFVLNMPVVLTIPSCLTFFEDDDTICNFLYAMVDAHRDWDETGGKERMLWNEMLRMLRMEGFEDVIEEKLRNDKNTNFSGEIVYSSIEWNNMQGMNSPEFE
ncbi:hypothetical protein BLNAU_12381 [Blattamonas nauphoetae]|uniref:Uncharacterized protein n=1 Tax=Blattamonas nauphoetae TaxID=2049346 RepID=A0ABQ9XJX2_9EUKA|nr:hypothetical protein BLNAU_12381 [Blattamonas nauphoetae]